MAETVPYLLGALPDESAVVVFLHETSAVGVLRLDLPQDTQDPSRDEDFALALVECLLGQVRCLQEAVPDRAAVVLYHDTAADTTDSGSRAQAFSDLVPLVHFLTTAITGTGLPVADVTAVVDGHWLSYTSPDPHASASGRVLPALHEDSAVAAAAAVAGLGAPQRLADIRRALAPTGDTLLVFGEVAARLREEVDRVGMPHLRRETAALAARALEGVGRDRTDLPVGEAAARIVLGVGDKEARDQVIMELGEATYTDAAVLWRHLASQSPTAAEAVEPLSVFAWAELMGGDQTVARVALDRILDADPQHSFAGLLLATLNAGVSPQRLASAVLRQP